MLPSYVDWRHICIYSWAQYGHGGGPTDLIIVGSHLQLSVFQSSFSCDQVLSDSSLMTKTHFDTKCKVDHSEDTEKTIIGNFAGLHNFTWHFYVHAMYMHFFI